MLPASGDITFVDSTSSLDRSDCRFFRMVTSSPAGGLPLAYLVCSNETEDLLTQAFQTLQDILPDYSWFKRDKRGCMVYMTDDCKAEYNALK